MEAQSETATAEMRAAKTLWPLFRRLTSGETTERCLHPECVCRGIFRPLRTINNSPRTRGKLRTQFFLNRSSTGLPPRMRTPKKFFVAVTANSRDGLTRAERLLSREMFTSLSRTHLDNHITDRIAPVFASRSFHVPLTAERPLDLVIKSGYFAPKADDLMCCRRFICHVGYKSISSVKSSSLLGASGRAIVALLALLCVMPVAALAQGSPFDTGFNAIQALFTGTIAKVASLVAIVIGGYGFAHGEPGAKKALAGVAAGTGIAVLAVNVLSWLWGV